MRLRGLRCNDGDLVFRRSGSERIDRPFRTGGREHEKIACVIEGQVHRIERIIAFNRQTFARRPAKDSLLMSIDEVKLAGGIDCRAGDGEEPIGELLDF